MVKEYHFACSPQAAAPPQAQVATPTAVPAIQPSTTELRVYGDNTAGNDQIIGTLVEGFTRQYPEVTVKVYQFTNLPDKQIPDLVKSGNTPDLIMTHDGVLPYLTENGLLLNLREFMAGDLLFKLDELREQALQSGQVFGKSDQYVLPVAVDTEELFYNLAQAVPATTPLQLGHTVDAQVPQGPLRHV